MYIEYRSRSFTIDRDRPSIATVVDHYLNTIHNLLQSFTIVIIHNRDRSQSIEIIHGRGSSPLIVIDDDQSQSFTIVSYGTVLAASF